ncbi:MAG: hypothetical protein ACRCUY_06445 [Thermoguttaceae bacterium]
MSRQFTALLLVLVIVLPCFSLSGCAFSQKGFKFPNWFTPKPTSSNRSQKSPGVPLSVDDFMQSERPM